MERPLDAIRGIATVRPEDIVRHHDAKPDENPWVDGAPPPPEWVEVVSYDSDWPSLYRQLAEQIRQCWAMQRWMSNKSALPQCRVLRRSR